MERRAKILMTLGPASAAPKTLKRLLKAGANAVRLNLSHGTRENHRELIRRVRAASEQAGVHIPIVLDLMGPRYRLGRLGDEQRLLTRGDTVQLGEGSGTELPIGSRGLVDRLRVGQRVLIDNGLVEVVIEDITDGTVTARVAAGGPVSSRKGINLPDTDLPFRISKKDREDIAFAVAEGADYLAVSYVASPADLKAVRRVVAKAGGSIPLIAKIERAAAIEQIDGLVEEADAVMVARGDLGVEVPLDQVPVLQKQIIAASRRTGTPVIVATQMLESMMERKRPTRAEATDVANAVFDGTDALMLSGETAAGEHPVEAVATMARIITRAESYAADGNGSNAHSPRTRPERYSDARREIADVVCAAGVLAADKLGVRCLVAFSQGGFTARSLARYRPNAPILVFTNEPSIARQNQLVWGVLPLLIDEDPDHLDRVVEVVDQRLRSLRLAKKGDSFALLMGSPIPERPMTNLLRIHQLGS